MIKVIEFFRRKTGMSRVDFLSHWQSSHTGVVLGVQNLRHYVQNPVAVREGDPEPPFDGMVEVWFDSIDSLKASMQSDYWHHVVADEDRFVDRASMRAILCDGDGTVPSDAGAKLVAVIRPRNGADNRAAIAGMRQALSRFSDDIGIDVPDPAWKARQDDLFADAVVSLRFSGAEEMDACRRALPGSSGASGKDPVVLLWMEERPIRVS